MPQRTGTYRLAGRLQRESFYPIVQGYKNVAGVGLRLNLSDPLQFNRLHLSAVLLARRGPAVERAGAPRAPNTSGTTGARRPCWNNADFYDLFGPDQGRPQGLRRFSSGTATR